MKREMDLIRKMILALEEAPSGFAPQDLHVDGYSPEQIGYHAHLMIEEGLAKGTSTTHLRSSSPAAIVRSLTWAGHEFADAARDEARWKKAMGMVKEKTGSVSIAVLTQLLTGLMKGALGLP